MVNSIFILNNAELINKACRVLNPKIVWGYLTKYNYIDLYHPFCFKNPKELDNYYSRMKYMEEVYNTLYSPRLIVYYEFNEFNQINGIKVHQNFILAELEFLVRELENKNYKYHFQYSYLSGSHPWDSFIRNIMNN